MKLNWAEKIAYLLLIVGGINWGLVGWANYNLVDAIFGEGSTAARVVYAVVGAATLCVIYSMAMMSSKRQ